MTSRRLKKTARSLSDLGKLVKDIKATGPHIKEDKVEKTVSKTPGPLLRSNPPMTPKADPETSTDNDDRLFIKAMAGVTPLLRDNHWYPPEKPARKKRGARLLKPDEPEIKALNRLIEEGTGFRVDQTPEYMESGAPDVDSNLIRRLHQGRFAVQGHIDLHGLTGSQAQEVLTHFIHDALISGKRMVLVIHGRGLTSPGEPVLKNMVYVWLKRGPYRRHVLAFTSARSCDGGAGATYVLLRRQPWTKKRKQ